MWTTLATRNAIRTTGATRWRVPRRQTSWNASRSSTAVWSPYRIRGRTGATASAPNGGSGPRSGRARSPSRCCASPGCVAYASPSSPHPARTYDHVEANLHLSRTCHGTRMVYPADHRSERRAAMRSTSGSGPDPCAAGREIASRTRRLSQCAPMRRRRYAIYETESQALRRRTRCSSTRKKPPRPRRTKS
jgi:hypothetical protein